MEISCYGGGDARTPNPDRLVLKMIGYDGYLGFDLGMTPSLVEDYRKSVDRIQALASKLQLQIEV